MTEEDLFELALSLPPAERAALLDRECAGDLALRRRMEALLRADAEPDALLSPAQLQQGIATEAFAGSRGERPGILIAGRYKLLQQIGEGGMGTVWMAEQTEPVKRRVAVKLIHAERGSSKTILSRFEAERQAIALMDHPNIARLLDAGTTDAGSPFFVMELVRGVPLTEYCDTHQLTIPQRLELFQQICSAVQHAHQKGIIHRDLKPSNILVESHDGKPVPKVIDFGLAKATSGMKLTEHTLFTAFGSVAGTPLYMAPEQANFSAVDIDTRADVYALGVLLYELLTGTTPITRETFKSAALDEMLRLIREQDAPTPSSRLSSSDAQPRVAANRREEPARLGRFVKGELDWIVMKALAKERDRRYDTASGFSKDVERFLNHEPVQAGPPSVRYRFKKFFRRNRAQVIAASLVLGALLAGIAGTTWGLVRANRAADSERIARLEAQDQKAKAEQAEADTLADYRASTDDAIEQLIGSKDNLGPKERTYLENTLKRWQSFANRQGDDERSQAIRAEGHHRMALLWARLSRNEEARTEWETAREIQKKLVELFPTVPEYQHQLATTHNNLGLLCRKFGQAEASRSEYQAALEIGRKLTEKFSAVPEYRERLASTHSNLADVLTDLEEREEAQAEFQAALDILNELSEQFPRVPDYRERLSTVHGNMGKLAAGLQKSEQALAEYQVAIEIQRKLVEEFPTVPSYQQEMARAHSNLGSVLAALERTEEARAEVQVARDIFKKLVEQFPAVPGYRHGLAAAQNGLGLLLARLERTDEARVEFASAQDIVKKLVDEFPSVPMYQIDLGGIYCNYGNMVHDEGEIAESLKWFGIAIGVLQPVHDHEPHNPSAKRYLRNGYGSRAGALDQLKNPVEAVKDWDRAMELSPPNERSQIRADRAFSQFHAGMVAEAVAEVSELTAADADSPDTLNWSAGKWYGFAGICAVASEKFADKKQEHANKAMDLLRRAVSAGYNDITHLKSDSNLDPLRDREDFKKLLAELEKK